MDPKQQNNEQTPNPNQGSQGATPPPERPNNQPANNQAQPNNANPEPQTTISPNQNDSQDPAQNVPHAPIAQPAQPPQQSTENIKPSNKKRNIIIVVSIIVLLAIIGAGFVFGYYIPNRPENVWRDGLDRSGDTLETIASDATSEENLKELQRSQVYADIEAEMQDMGGSGNLSMQFDNNKFSGEIDFNIESQGEQLEMGAEVLAEVAENNNYPDIYFKLSGVDALGFGMLMPDAAPYDDRWFAVSSEFIESEMGDVFDESDFDFNTQNLTSQDVSEFSEVLTQTTSEYIFTSDEDKAVLVKNEFIESQEINDRDSNLYNASINKNNYIEFCRTLSERIFETEAAQKTMNHPDDAEMEERLQASQENCDRSMEDFDEDYTFDLWIDRQYRLVNQMRFYDTDNTDRYIDVGQHFDGGDEITFFTNFDNIDDDINNGDISMTTNFETNKTEGNLSISSGDGNNPLSLSANFSIEPFHEEIDTERPEDAEDIEDLFEAMLQ